MKSLITISIIYFAYALSACHSKPEAPLLPATTGYNSLFMGHSFFEPVAQELPEHAARAGFSEHSQQIYYSAGPSGSPQGLWNDTAKRFAIQALLDDGDIELFGMTYHSDHPTATGYINWVDYALQQNPNTLFFVAAPWPIYPDDMTVAEYQIVWQMVHTTIHEIIDTLRSQYPNNYFYCIPYGMGSTALKERFESGNLPDVQTLIGGVYADSLGHPLDILTELSELVWLQSIYGVGLSEYQYDPGYMIDLKALAHDIAVEHDHRYDAPLHASGHGLDH